MPDRLPLPPGPLAVVAFALPDADAAALQGPVVRAGDAAAFASVAERAALGAIVAPAAAVSPGLLDELGGAPDPPLPLVLLVDPSEAPPTADAFGLSFPVTALRRPIPPSTLRAVVSLACESRRREVRIRDLLADRPRVADRAAGRAEATAGAEAEALRARAAHDRELARALAHAENAERERIAEHLHDGLLQVLVGLRMHVALLPGHDDPGGTPARVAALVDEAIDQTRWLSADLGPPTPAGGGLAALLEWVVGDASDRHGLEVTLDVGDGPEPSPDARALLSRATRELLRVVGEGGRGGPVVVGVGCEGGACRLEVRHPGVARADLRDLGRRAELVGGAVSRLTGAGGAAIVVTVPGVA